MSNSPYRAIEDEDGSRERADAGGASTDDIRPVLVIFWITSLIRVIHALSSGETFGPEATLAALAVLLMPFLGSRRPG